MSFSSAPVAPRVVVGEPKEGGILQWLLSRMHRARVRGTGRLTAFAIRNNPFPIIRTRTSHGLTYFADPKSPLDLSVLGTGYYEPHILDAIAPLLGDGDVFWDVGANHGIHSITVKHLRPGVRVVSFEPSPLSFTRLYLNAKANKLELDLRCVALSDERGFAPLSISDEWNSGLSSLKPWPDVNYSMTLACWCETGDGLVAGGQVPAPNVVKIDVEGFELEVFEGMRTLLSSPALRHVVFEGRRDLLDEKSSYPLARMLVGHGFSIRSLNSQPPDWIASRQA